MIFDEPRAHTEVLEGVATESGKEDDRPLPVLLSLFCGPGGMDLGFKQAGFSVSLAIDHSGAAIRTHRRNLRNSVALEADLSKLGAAGVVSAFSRLVKPGTRIGIIGGPPCQGFSRANIRSRADDPRNQLPKLYIDIVRALKEHYSVDFVVMENVLGIRDKKHASTFAEIVRELELLGLKTSVNELCALDFGVPQRRRRVILTGLSKNAAAGQLSIRPYRGKATVADAIGHIKKQPTYFSRDVVRTEIPHHPNHWTMRPRSSRFASIVPHSNSKNRSFKRLLWDEPSPTVAYGNREIHVHPSGKRRLSIYEALLLQGFPDRWVLEGNLSEQVEQVSNAVPPPLARAVARAVLRALRNG